MSPNQVLGIVGKPSTKKGAKTCCMAFQFTIEKILKFKVLINSIVRKLLLFLFYYIVATTQVTLVSMNLDLHITKKI